MSAAMEPWKVTVVYGKESFEVDFEHKGTEEEGEHLITLIQRQVTLNFGIEKEYQKLVYRGKELKNGTTIKNNSKIMLLLNQKYYEQAKNNGTKKRSEVLSSSSVAVTETTTSSAPFSIISTSSTTTTTGTIDLEDIGEEELLVQVSRGKDKYEFVFSRESQVKVVKDRLGELTGVDGNGIRLVMKGKTPKDEDLLENFSTSQRMIKCMMLLKASQHIYMEKQSELRDLQNELTQLQLKKKKIERQIARNFGSKEEMAIQLACLEDGVKNIVSNLDILQDVLHKRQGSNSTSNVLVSTIKEAKDLVIAIEKLQNQFKTY